jgi:Mg2+ and Co2+ transporter CorA
MCILERNVKRISFEDIRRPNLVTNDALHDHRQEIDYTLSEVAKTSKWISPSVGAELEAIKDSLPASKYIGYPHAVLQDVLDNAESLQSFLMDTFQLLLSSISFQEAEASKRHAHRGQLLTQLACFYLPLSLVTGIFGMNVREINGSPLSIWTSIVALLVISTVTATAFVIYRGYEKLFKQTSCGGQDTHSSEVSRSRTITFCKAACR